MADLAYWAHLEMVDQGVVVPDTASVYKMEARILLVSALWDAIVLHFTEILEDMELKTVTEVAEQELQAYRRMVIVVVLLCIGNIAKTITVEEEVVVAAAVAFKLVMVGQVALMAAPETILAVVGMMLLSRTLELAEAGRVVVMELAVKVPLELLSSYIVLLEHFIMVLPVRLARWEPHLREDCKVAMRAMLVQQVSTPNQVRLAALLVRRASIAARQAPILAAIVLQGHTAVKELPRAPHVLKGPTIRILAQIL